MDWVTITVAGALAVGTLLGLAAAIFSIRKGSLEIRPPGWFKRRFDAPPS
jgi:hypothetical protein